MLTARQWSLVVIIGLGLSGAALRPLPHPTTPPATPAPPRVVLAGGGAYAPPREQFSAAVYRALEKRPRRPQTAPTVRFRWPVRWAAGFSDAGFYGVANFVDHDPANPDQLRDYETLTRTYDLEGYNHTGTDIFLWPFAWQKMAAGAVEVVAAAAGTIYEKFDGHADQNCDFSNPDWNAVYVLHSDNSLSMYGHLKKNSLTPKNIGDPVAAGDYLGLVGSSGYSTGPHLHFEVRDADNQLIDPYIGPGNPTISQTLWLAQKPYYESAINHLGVGAAAPEKPATCPPAEAIHEDTNFLPGTPLYFSAYYHDQRAGQVSTYTLYLPNNTVYIDWTHSPTGTQHFNASYWFWKFTFPTDLPLGAWRFVVEYEGQTYEQTFNLTTVTATPSPTRTTTRTATSTATRFGTATATVTHTSTPIPAPAQIYLPMIQSGP